MDIKSFLYGMYYAGKLPSRAEYKEISNYLRKSGFVGGNPEVIEKQVAEAIADIHRMLHHDDGRQKGEQR